MEGARRNLRSRKHKCGRRMGSVNANTANYAQRSLGESGKRRGVGTNLERRRRKRRGIKKNKRGARKKGKK